MRTFTIIGFALITALIHGCGAGDNSAQSPVEAAPEASPATMETPEPPAEPAVLNHAVDPATLGLMIDPVCKMIAPFSPYRRSAPGAPWFCSPRCEEAYRQSPQTYPPVR